jgi:rod shape-determining protein MreC
MERRRRRLWNTIAVITLIVLAQFVIFQPVRDIGRRIIAVPVNVVGSVSRKIVTTFSLVGSISDLAAENARLKDENAQYLAELAKLENIENENTQLKQDLKFSQDRSDLSLLPATITNYSPVGSYQAVTIDKGKDDGVVENQAVVSGGFLVGKIKNVSNSTAEVWLLSNRSLLTPVILTGSNVTGILKGGIRGLVVENIPIDTPIKKGELVVTSSLEQLYPAGLAIGQVEEVLSQEEEIFTRVRIATPINIANIRTLFVVK